ncbi:parn-2 [Pristionchus pacificus]|uniref:Parn-2 n=1 Tax=Pristionchus pacificus TaxID=54126 RepID=A0A2A6CTL3_PRIPA|nr:parn-2 [Pristionchus pacificus]|eukprot:PDM81426.1 parn-2 [Pristionchus pacificus]
MRMPATGVSFDEIPVIEVNRENIDRLWPHLILSIRKATLIALDLELSGLGERAAINAASLEDRYAAMSMIYRLLRQAATTRSVLSLGIALFERQKTKKEKRVAYKCQVFNVLSLCAEPFTMEPDALRFLADHSFDFNRYVRQGVSYHAAHQSAKSANVVSEDEASLSEYDIDHIEVHAVELVPEVVPPKCLIQAVIDTTPIEFELDTGSAVSVIGYQTWKALGSPSLQETHRAAKAYGGQLLRFRGVLQTEDCKLIDLYKSCPLRSLLDELLSPRAPIALHNGLVDLIFLYAHFYTTPPPTLSQFVADLADLFPSGAEDKEQDEVAPIVDSKFVAEYMDHMPASYLEYVFRKSQRDNFLEAAEGRVHVKMSFSGCVIEIVPSSSLERVGCSLPTGFPDQTVDTKTAIQRLCAQFANHGFCRKGAACTHAHDVDLALDVEKIKSEKVRRRRKRRLDAQAGLERSDEKEDGVSMASSGDRDESTGDTQQQPREPFSVTGAHRAGVDAFMTGFAVLYHARMSLLKDGGSLPATITNRIPLSGKDRPLHLVSSRLIECSTAHLDRVMLARAARKKADAARAHV